LRIAYRRQKLVEKYLVYNPKNGDTINLTAAPEGMAEPKVQILSETRERYPGTLRVEGEEVVIRLRGDIQASPIWHYYRGYRRVSAKFMGTRLQIKALTEEELRTGEQKNKETSG